MFLYYKLLFLKCLYWAKKPLPPHPLLRPYQRRWRGGGGEVSSLRSPRAVWRTVQEDQSEVNPAPATGEISPRISLSYTTTGQLAYFSKIFI